ncbi:hypothetical protein HPB47_015668, partial [Ixodes persulcatus]
MARRRGAYREPSTGPVREAIPTATGMSRAGLRTRAVLNRSGTAVKFETRGFENRVVPEQLDLAPLRAGSCRRLFESNLRRRRTVTKAPTRGYRMKRTKCASLLKNVLYPHFKSDLAADVGQSRFSIIIDESTDISAIKHVLKEFKLDLCNMVGIGTDNASVMTAVNNGVYQKLKAEVPNLILVRSVCHYLELAISAAVADCLPRTWNTLSARPSRQLAYQRLYNAINELEDSLKTVQACSTRWLSIERAVSRIVEQWLELKTHFEMARSSERCYDAEMLHAMYVDDINWAYLFFLKPLLTEAQAVNKSSEAKDTDQMKLLDDLECLLPYLGYLLENHVNEMKKKGLSPQDEDALRKRCVKFVVCLVQQLRQRLPENIEVLSKVAQLSVEKALSALKPSLIPLLEAMGVEGPDIQEIESHELNLVKTKLRNRMAPAMANGILTIRADLKRHAKTCFDYELPEVVRRIGTAEAYKAGNE